MSYRVTNHKLDGVEFVDTPNKDGEITPEIIIIHSTESRLITSTVRWFQSPTSKASAHLVMGRDGKLVQMVAFNQRAWHAGQSAWKGKPKCNSFAIGIELCNWGRVFIKDGVYKSVGGTVLEKNDVIEATHKLAPGKKFFWETFTPEQISASKELCMFLVDTYKLKDIVGHEDIALPQGRKTDPGPAFQMKELRESVFGEGTPDDPFVGQDLENTKALMEVKESLVNAVKRIDYILNRRND